MHLLKVVRDEESVDDTLSIELEYFVAQPPPYAILSHRWGAPADEVTFQDLSGDLSSAKKKRGYRKVEQCCIHALEYGLGYAWIDTCCIDKSSSVELSEAINSMYAWYAGSTVCFAYLEDVSTDEQSILSGADSAFRESVWFTRGWTLQELLAPMEVIFFASDWNPRPMGSKSTLAGIIESVTIVRRDILLDSNQLQTASIAEKMSWASNRETTRLEDEAYSLMGLFGVSMPTIYGEGRRAFLRLQEEIVRSSPDHSIFAWEGDSDNCGMLATSPKQSARSAGYEPMNYNDFKRFQVSFDANVTPDSSTTAASIQPSYSMTNFGLQIQLPLSEISAVHFPGYHVAFIACTYRPPRLLEQSQLRDEPTMIVLRQQEGRPQGHFYRTRFNNRTTLHRPVPPRGFSFRVSNPLIWISGPPSFQYSSMAGHIKLESAYAGFDAIHLVVDYSRARKGTQSSVAIQCCPPSALTTLPSPPQFMPDPSQAENSYAVLRQGSHVALMFRGLRTTPQSDMMFVFGMHNGRVWFDFDIARCGVLGDVDKYYWLYDLLSGSSTWRSTGDDNKIKYFSDIKSRLWAQMHLTQRMAKSDTGHLIPEYVVSLLA